MNLIVCYYRLFLLTIITVIVIVVILSRHKTPFLQNPFPMPATRKSMCMHRTALKQETCCYSPAVECVQNLPDVVIIGVQKSGTTGLRDALNFHPRIAARRVEVHFFNANYTTDSDSYRRKMAYSCPTQLTLEKSPNYFTDKYTPRRMKYLLGNRSKFIVTMRDPTNRLVSSHFLYLRKQYVKWPRDIRKNIIKRGVVDKHNVLVWTGLYALHLKKWFRYFDRSQFHFVDGERFIKEPWIELQKIETFLNIEPFFTEERFHFNKDFGLLVLDDYIEHLTRCQPRFLKKRSQRERSVTNDTEFLDMVREFYKPYNRLLAEYEIKMSWNE